MIEECENNEPIRLMIIEEIETMELFTNECNKCGSDPLYKVNRRYVCKDCVTDDLPIVLKKLTDNRGCQKCGKKFGYICTVCGLCYCYMHLVGHLRSECSYVVIKEV